MFVISVLLLSVPTACVNQVESIYTCGCTRTASNQDDIQEPGILVVCEGEARNSGRKTRPLLQCWSFKLTGMQFLDLPILEF